MNGGQDAASHKFLCSTPMKKCDTWLERINHVLKECAKIPQWQFNQFLTVFTCGVNGVSVYSVYLAY
jgi:hypothetical protein